MIKQGKLILNSTPNKMLYFPKTEEEKKAMQQKFGWSNEDYRQQIVGGNIQNAVAKPEDFLPFVFRHLSATIVGAGGWKATEFTDAVLKAAASKLTYQPVYVNHEMEVSNIVGVNGEIEYVPKSKADDGTDIPGGLQGAIWIDGLLNQDLTRKLTAYPVPHIQSVSVSVSYNWQPSHTFQDRNGQEDDWEFENLIGTIVEGRMVRRIVTEIIEFYETSLVYLGADPFAKILDENGKPFNIEKSAVVGKNEFSKDPLNSLYKKDGTILLFDESVKENSLLHLKQEFRNSFSKTGNYKEPKQTKFNTMTLQAAVAKKLGKLESEVTPEILDSYSIVTKADFDLMKAAFDAKTVLEGAKTKAESDLAAAKETIVKYEGICKVESIDATKTAIENYGKICKVEDVAELSKEISADQFIHFAKAGKTLFTSKKEECVRLYKLTIGEGKESQSVIDLIKKSNESELNGLLEQYGGKLIDSFGGHCGDCNSTKLVFRSSEAEVVATTTTGKGEETSMAERRRG